MERRKSKQVIAGGVAIGGGAPVTVQSMLNVPSTDLPGSVEQAVRLEQAGCQILRAAIPNKEAVALIPAIKDCILQVDVESNKMVIHLMKGLV